MSLQPVPLEVDDTKRVGAREWLALAVLTLAVIMLAVDGTVLALAVPALTADLNPSSSQILWVGDIYSFALAGLLITMGNVADRIGRKKLLLIGAFGFGVSSVIAAFATTPEMLIAGRAILGISGATLMPSTLSIVRNLFLDPRQRTRAIAIWSAGATGGAAAGPIVGGALLEHYWWGSVFLINVPIILVVIVAGYFLLPESRNPERTPIDLVSALLSIVAIVPTVYAVKHWVGSGFDWTVPVAAIIGISAGYAFLRRQRILTSPLIDLSLFRIPAFSGAVAANGIAIFAFVGLLFFFSQYLQLVKGLSPLQAGLAELPSTLASMAVIAIAAWSAYRLGRGNAIAAGLLVASIGLAGMAVTESMPGLTGVIISLSVVGLGSGLAMTLSTDAVVSAAPRERAGAASSIAETAYELGVALGIAILGSLQTALYRNNLPALDGLPDAVASQVKESLATAVRVIDPSTASGEHWLETVRHAFTSGMQTTSVVAAVLLALAALVAWRIIPSPRGEQPVAEH